MLRINSPGGTPAAAQEISEEIAAVRAAGKVVVTSMADVAASGAYWIAATTDHIMADAGTTTGSIGVIWQVPNYEELYRKFGIDYVTFASGAHKDMGSSSRPLTPEEEDIMRAMIDEMYNQFVDTVAGGRRMPREKVVALADGRVYTGSQAKENGLVDSLGGLQKAIGKAAEMAGVEDGYQVIEFGRQSPWDILLGEARALLRQLRLAAGLSGLSSGQGGLTGTETGEGPK